MGAPYAVLEGACGLCEQCKSLVWDFIGFLCKPRNISLFFLLYSLHCKFSPYLSLYLYISLATPSTLQIPWIQLGLNTGEGPFPCFLGKEIQAYLMQLTGRRSQLETLGIPGILPQLKKTPFYPLYLEQRVHFPASLGKASGVPFALQEEGISN